MIYGAVFDTNEKSREYIRKWLISFLIKENMEMDMLWFSKEVSEGTIAKYVDKIHLALISIDCEYGSEVGKNLYKLNPSCRICYNRSIVCDVIPLLSSRPIGFYIWQNGEEEFAQIISMIIKEISTAKDIFRYETKKGLYLIPIRNILYMQSDLKYVQIHKVNGTQEKIFAKLTQVEEKLNNCFVRIHKSYIVNRDYVSFIDKKEHMAVLCNGEHIPISEAQYGKAMEKLRNNRITEV